MQNQRSRRKGAKNEKNRFCEAKQTKPFREHSYESLDSLMTGPPVVVLGTDLAA